METSYFKVAVACVPRHALVLSLQSFVLKFKLMKLLTALKGIRWKLVQALVIKGANRAFNQDRVFIWGPLPLADRNGRKLDLLGA